MDVISKARELRRQIESNANQNMNDEKALNYSELFPIWTGAGELYEVGQRVRYGNSLFKVLVTHRSQPDWTPTTAVSVFTEVLPGGISKWVQPSSANPYMKGDKVVFGEKVYESITDNNVWNPEAYPAGWEMKGA